jgi:hypothetical protein
MTWNFHQRLRHGSDRMKEGVSETITIRRGLDEIEVTASIILEDAQEIIPGVAVTRVEVQYFGIDCVDIEFSDNVHYPLDSDIFVRASGDEFRPMHLGETTPPWKYVTSTRDRILVATQRVLEG